MEIRYSPRFKRAYKKLPSHIRNTAEEKVKLFRKDPFDKRLSAHKLKGRLRGLWSFSINDAYRIIFELSDDKETAYFHTIGDHSIYD